MYIYKVNFALMNEKAELEFGDIEEAINASIAKYNDEVNHRSGKSLSCTIYPRHLEIEIHSDIALEVPSKSLAKFTRILIDEAPILKDCIVHKRVFKSISPVVQERREPASDETLDFIDALDTVKKVMELFYEKTPMTFDEKRIKEAKQNSIKRIVFEL